MNDEQYTPALGTWLKDSDVPPPDPHASARRIMAELPAFETTRRWWPFHLLGPRARTPIATDTAVYQPSPIPASNGNTPTVIGRTMTMFSPAKTIIAASLVFGVGGVMLIAHPFDQQSSVPGAATEAAPQPPTEFTGVWCIGPEVADRALAWKNAVSMSDPRLQGDAYQTYETHTYAGGVSVISQTESIVNEDGAWVWLSYRKPSGAVGTDDVFVGEGAYEGLIALMSDGTAVPLLEGLTAEYGPCNEVAGVIIDGAVTEPYRPE